MDEPCAAEQNAMPRCNLDHFHRGVACEVCIPRLKKKLLRDAIARYGSDDVMIQESAEVDKAEDGSGTWVQAWVWVSNE